MYMYMCHIFLGHSARWISARNQIPCNGPLIQISFDGFLRIVRFLAWIPAGSQNSHPSVESQIGLVVTPPPVGSQKRIISPCIEPNSELWFREVSQTLYSFPIERSMQVPLVATAVKLGAVVLLWRVEHGTVLQREIIHLHEVIIFYILASWLKIDRSSEKGHGLRSSILQLEYQGEG